MAIDMLGTGTPAITRSRRAVLTAAMGGLGGLFAARLGAPAPAAAAAGDPLLIGNVSNNAGTANTTLTTSSVGTALLVTQNGAGTAIRGSAVGAGSIAGFFTANNGTGISGVTGNANSYGVFGSNDAVAGGSAGAIRADGNANNGLVASTDSANRNALKASHSAVGGTVAVFENTSGDVVGPAIRAFSGGGTTADVEPPVELWDAAGEFAGPHGVLGVAVVGGGVGVTGRSATGIGLHGQSTSGSAVLAESATGYAGVFDGKVHISGLVDIFEKPLPANPSANIARLFVRDNGGKTELCVIFPTGVVQVIKTEV